MLNEVTRLTKGDFSKFKEKKYQSILEKMLLLSYDRTDVWNEIMKR